MWVEVPRAARVLSLSVIFSGKFTLKGMPCVQVPSAAILKYPPVILSAPTLMFFMMLSEGILFMCKVMLLAALGCSI